ncbi:radical SAM protein [Micromonospora sp. WMMD1082]|uniref:B12-binding domain-containing radical SAM protein n=1 Tax=Micromonospora sp. WMMD1082 TaxID=3016104 RepID=UPI0024180E71|nr:radical SAM protein [Micromonospora sp. WMMD1082]MDG4796936.1 radical SAM protein [Micromonospora sp. WMMD1082]
MTDPDRARVLVWAPTLYESGFKQRHVDGDALAVQASLRTAGYDSVLLDAYYRGRPAVSLADTLADAAAVTGFDVLVVHLFTSDAYGPRLRRIADELVATRLRHPRLAVIGFGPLAVSAAGELMAHGAVDHVVAGPATVATDPFVAGLLTHLRAHLAVYTSLRSLTAADLPYGADSVVSVAASRGCRSRCTFCAYNADLPGGGWRDMPMAPVVDDIAHLHQAIGATAFAFSDSDFGGTRHECARRAVELRDGLRATGLAGTLTFAISVRAETLDPDTVGVLADAGVRTMLIGVESFNPDTLHRVYGKRQNLTHLREVVAAADDAAVTTVASYILWHPWQTLDGLRTELDALHRFGRHRIPHFMARSRLEVIPGTVIERQIAADGLLITAPFHRAFTIADPAAAAVADALTEWFATTAAPVLAGLHEADPGSLDRLAELKIAEWAWLTETVHREAACHG